MVVEPLPCRVVIDIVMCPSWLGLVSAASIVPALFIPALRQ
jgi:hypothetical protein